MTDTEPRGRQVEVGKLIDEARKVVATHDATPSGPSEKETWDREFMRARALDYLRRICAVDAGQLDPGASSTATYAPSCRARRTAQGALPLEVDP